MPNGIDPHKFNPNVSGTSVRQKYGLNGKVVIGFVGWFRRWHGLDMLIRVFHEINLKESGAKLMLVGDGPASSELHAYVRKCGLGDQVIFTGAVKRNEIPPHIAAMDITVQPSAPEYACPMKIFEYMAMGKCIVAPNQPNIQEILENGVNGYLFGLDDQNEFGKVLVASVRNSADRQIIGQNAYGTIRRKDIFGRRMQRRC